MQQIFQNLKTGEVQIENVPLPHCGSGRLLIKVSHSLVSIGTEKMLVDFGKAGWLAKAQQQPDKVKQVISKIKTDGIAPTVNAVMNKLDQPLPLGYSAVGEVIEVGAGTAPFKVGDRVVCNGPHAEYVLVPKHLAARIPDHVSNEEAAFTVVGAIGLQGVRLLNPTLGETIVVVGLGLIGLITVQILIANGCKVICYDFEKDKVDRAREYGAQAFQLSDMTDPVIEVLNATNGIGADGVVITASTRSDEVISQSALMTRVRGRVVLVGVVGLHLKRSDFYDKEITFQVSCSYGPGRYDTGYEDKGVDYPIGFVRWTEERNFQAILELLNSKKLNVRDLITQIVEFEKASQFYSALGENKKELGVLLRYNLTQDLPAKTVQYASHAGTMKAALNISLIGAGQFASSVLLPAFQKHQFDFVTIGSRTGALGAHLSKKYHFRQLTTDYENIFADPKVQNVLISTRHNTHGTLVLKALQAGKNVFVEKPLALNESELGQIESFYKQPDPALKPVLMVGFNRRFAPLSRELKKEISKVNVARSFIMTVNAGAIPMKHWTQDPEVGGGRLVGEGCHFIDLLRYLSGSAIQQAQVVNMKSEANDSFSIQMSFANGDMGVIHYLSNGNKDFPKERLEVFVGGKILTLDNFRTLRGIGVKRLKYTLSSQDKGHSNEVYEFGKAVQSQQQPIPLDEIFEVSRWSIKLQKMLNQQVHV